MSDLDQQTQAAATGEEITHRDQPLAISGGFLSYFLAGGLLFLIASLCLFAITGYMAFRYSRDPSPMPMINGNQSGEVTRAEVLRFASVMLESYMPLVFSFVSAVICAPIGIRFLKTSGVATSPIVAPQDYPILGPAIASGNDKAIDQWVRLSSLSGMTGTFTKIGLTGLPLATITLTVLLAIGGLFSAQFFDLAKLTLGAFLGSFVQRQQRVDTGISVARQAAAEAVRNARP